MYDAPIPGQSLTSAPRSHPYERPPEITDPEEALKMHIQRLGKPEVQEAILDGLELDVDIVTMTEGILRGAVAGGIHSIDVSQLIAPVIHKFIKRTAEDAGVEYDEGFEDKDEEKSRKEAIEEAKAYKRVSKRLESLGQEPEAKPEAEAEAPPAPVEQQGIVPRRTTE